LNNSSNLSFLRLVPITMIVPVASASPVLTSPSPGT
jgi:hypothetical protein